MFDYAPASRPRSWPLALAVLCIGGAVAVASCLGWLPRAQYAATLVPPVSSFANGPFRIADTNSYSLVGLCHEEPGSPADLGGGVTVRCFHFESVGICAFGFEAGNEAWTVEAGWRVYVYSDASGVFRVVIDNGGPL